MSSTNKKSYLCFVDFSKVFDRVWREGVLVKLLRNGVAGKFYGSIKQMYLNTISAVKINNSITPTFKSEVGVKQSDNLTPTRLTYTSTVLFLEDSCDPIKLSSVSLAHLLWADDLLLMSESSVGLQKCF